MIADRILENAETRARRVGASAARIIVAGAFACVAFAFLTASAWLYLFAALGPGAASLILGLAFAFAAGIALMIKPHRPEPKKVTVGVDDIMQTFVMASFLGRAARR